MHSIVTNKKINNVIHNYLRLKKHNKLSVGIVDNKQIHIFNFDSENGLLKNDPEYIFDIGSISKVFTSLLIIKLNKQGFLSLDDGVDKYISLPQGHYPTIRMLLSHNCGYNHLTPIGITVPSLLKHKYSIKNVYENVTDGNVISALINRNKKGSVGYGYSDFSYAVLAIVAQNISNTCFSTLFDNFIKNDLGLQNSFIIKEDSVREKCYRHDREITNWIWHDNNPYIAGGGVASTMKEMCSFIDNVINNKIPGLDLALEKQFIVEHNKQVAYHTLSFQTATKATSVWHIGGVGEFRSSMTINTKRKTGIIVLGNSKGIKSGNVHYLCKLIYSELKRHKI